MAEHVTDNLNDLAFALLNGEKLDGKQAKLLDRAGSDPCEEALLRDSVCLLRDIREIDLSTGDNEHSNEEYFNEELLAAFLDGSLDHIGRERVIALLSKSRKARRMLAELAQTLRDAGLLGTEGTASFEYLIGVAKDALRFLLHPNDGFTLIQAQAAPVLGTTECEMGKACEWTQSSGDLSVTFRVFQKTDGRVHLHVSVASHDPAASCYQVTLFQDEQIAQSATVCDAEDCVFENVDTGIYRVEVAPLKREAVSFVLRFHPLP